MEVRGRTCIIGAGVSGLTAAKAAADWGVPCTVFEASDEVGGNWYFRNPNGRSSAYRSLHIDTSKNALSFEDFPMDARYPDFPHHSEIHRFLSEYADRFRLRENIRFQTVVQRAQRGPQGGWTIRTADGEEHAFANLLVCNGHHWDPSYPDFPGHFDGPTLHSHHYIDPTEPQPLRGKRVVVVGIGNSAVDIVSELSRKGVAEQVFISTRSGAWVVPKYVFGRPVDQVFKTIPWLSQRVQRRAGAILQRLVSGRMEDFGLPTPNHAFLEAHPTVSSELLLRLGSGDATAKPDIAELQGDRVRFTDGSVEAVDAIIYATGYRISFPFFDPEFLSAPGNVLRSTSGCSSPGSTISHSWDSDRRCPRSSRSPSARPSSRRAGWPGIGPRRRPPRCRRRSPPTSAPTPVITRRGRVTRCSSTTTSTRMTCASGCCRPVASGPGGRRPRADFSVPQRARFWPGNSVPLGT